MARYIVACDTCKKDMEVNLIGKHSVREWKLENYTWECEDCKMKARDIENLLAKKENEENELPTLLGSDKQIAWAETIRKTKSDELEKIINKINKPPKHLFTEKIEIENPTYKIDILFLENTATFWIDNRGCDIVTLLNNTKSENQIIEEDLELEVFNESIVRPKEVISETIAKITILHKRTIDIQFSEKNEEFRKLIKSYDFTWNAGWERKIIPINGSIEDRIAEIANVLLNEGFIISIIDEEIRKNAINGTYKPEHTRWIRKRIDGTYKDCFSISWKNYHEDFYKEAKNITSSKWSNPSVIIYPEHFEEVEDFAQMYDFRFSDSAKEHLEISKLKKENALIPIISKGAKSKKVSKELKLKPIQSNIDDSLRD